MKNIIFVLLFSYINFSAFADTGCRLTNGSIHSPQTGNALLGATLIPFHLGIVIPFYNSPTVSTGYGTCPSYAGNIMNTGRTCTTQAISILGLGIVAQNQGQEVSFSLIECSLDDYSLGLVAFAGALGLIMIKRREPC